ncbi:hypothetical protein KVP10_08415 [Candidimonas humi]|uniref:ParB/RepB/Spo0J family partition protein n=1 Tax=Candidimonas humi TaxID=683355 RepID=A0ABV8NW16_9BURK|nr:hypothetical protein [Candidimonas humi]MBV6304909.1 hypothetical protein [Candidimonas humi]
MAKNSIDAYGAAGKSNVLMFDPSALKVIDDPTHPLYDERIHLPLDEAMVLNIMALGVREPILVWKDPETGDVLIVDGRQRVAHALDANRRLMARGEPPIQVPGIPQRGTIERMGDIMISMNEARRGDAPLVRARKMAAFMERGYTEDRLAVIFACSEQSVRNTLTLLDCTQAVQSAAEAGQIRMTHVKALAKLDPAEQRTKIQELIAAGEGVKPHERARRQRAVLGESKPRMRTRREVEQELEAAVGERALALRWVLNLELSAEDGAVLDMEAAA